MNAALVLRTNLKWFMLVNGVTTIIFLPLMSSFVSDQNQSGVMATAISYGVVWFLSGLITGIADGASSRGLHRELAYASFMLLAALYLLLVGKIFWSAVIPLSWLAVALFSAIAAGGFIILQIYVRRQHQGYTKDEVFR